MVNAWLRAALMNLTELARVVEMEFLPWMVRMHAKIEAEFPLLALLYLFVAHVFPHVFLTLTCVCLCVAEHAFIKLLHAPLWLSTILDLATICFVCHQVIHYLQHLGLRLNMPFVILLILVLLLYAIEKRFWDLDVIAAPPTEQGDRAPGSKPPTTKRDGIRPIPPEIIKIGMPS